MASLGAVHRDSGAPRSLGAARRDVLTFGVAIAAIILFVGIGGSLMPKILRAWMDVGEAPDPALTNAMLLNIALLIFGWRRYRELDQEVQYRRAAEEKARLLAETDALTGCLNRRSGEPAVARLLEEARAEGREVAVLMIDLDNFKQINDLNGHSMGDKVLQTIAARVREVLPRDGMLARIGGDEFVCALTHETGNHDRIEKFANQLITAISSPVGDESALIEATMSLGIASSGQAPHTPDLDAGMLVHRADIAMYHAKKNGRNRHCWYDIQLEDELRFRNELEAAIRRGVPAGEFVPYYEQQVNLATGELTGFEMLARWASPKYGLVGPEVFIQVAEEIDLISDLSESLIRQAMRDAMDWDPSLTLSVNISPLQLRDPWFAHRLLHLLVESGFPARRLEVEITESCLHENIGAVRTIISSLKNQGIRITLDDFGTGYSSLSQLRSLPFDRLKIDRSFVMEMTREGGNDELVKAIISLARGLDLPIVAEGIEDARVLVTLRDLGYANGQGYLYGKPEDAAATRARLAGLDLLAKPVAELPTAQEAPVVALAHEAAARKAG